MVKNPPADVGDTRDSSSTPELGRFPGEGNGNPLHHSCLDNPMDRKTFLQGRKELDTTEATWHTHNAYIWNLERRY